mgnify:CR=1 FL=1
MGKQTHREVQAKLERRARGEGRGARLGFGKRSTFAFFAAWREIHRGARGEGRGVHSLLLFALVATLALLAGCRTNSGPELPRTPIAVQRPAAAPPAPTATPLPAAALAGLSTNEQLAVVEIPSRDRRLLTLQLAPDLDDIPVVVNPAPPARAIGDLENFWVHNISTETNVEITAELIYSTTVAYVWMERGAEYDHPALVKAVDRFSALTYPSLVNTFGSEWNPGVDNDPRLHILHTSATGPGVAGYFYSADEYSKLANPFSNEKEMFYINLSMVQPARDLLSYETVLAHEFQHMIHWYSDRGEETWLGEGLSEYAQHIAGYDGNTFFARTFAAAPDLQLNTWSPEQGNNAPHYGASYLFVSYLAQRLGHEFLTTLVAEPGNGFYGIQAALDARGVDVEADDLFADWVVANWVQDPDAPGTDGRYGYLDVHLPFVAAAVHDRYPVEAATTVGNYATDYIVVEAAPDGRDLRFDFTGATATRLAAAPIPPGEMVWWSNRADDANPRLTRTLDLSALAAGAPVTLTVEMWYDIEENYDYGYVLASRDGVKWTALPGQRTTADDPTGNNLGVGYTGASGGWITEQFDLSEYAGDEVALQFNYVTDDAVTTAGWLVRSLALTAAAGATSPIDLPTDWTSAGWLLTDNLLPQHWLLQVLEYDGDTLTGVRRVPVAEDGRAVFDLAGLGAGRSAVVAISGLTRGTTLPAEYRYALEPN